MLRPEFWFSGGKDGPRDTRTTVRDTTFDHCFRLGIDGYLAGTVDHAIAHDGLRIDGERGRSFVSLHCNSRRHGDCDDIIASMIF